tara:strand:+ start:4790 stop:6361 length:1572 start_codon:yes stop_codon:yes gene_type:complete
MAVTYQVYYFDGLNFSNATTVFDDQALTVVSADGFYAQNGIVRQQLNGVLLNAQACTSCGADCGSGISASFSGNGYFSADINVANSVGAVVIYCKMNSSVPDGIQATFDNVVYNKLTCEDNHNGVTLIDCNRNTNLDYAGVNNQPATGTNFTVVGNDYGPGLCGTYNNLDEYNLVNTSYVATGGTRNVTVVNNMVGCATDTSTPSSPVFTLVVPKTNINLTSVNVEIFAPITGTVFAWEILCPTALPSFLGSNLQDTKDCISPIEDYFFARNATGSSPPFTKDTNTTPDIGNFVYSDDSGTTPVNNTSALRYIIINNTTALGIRNGVVVSSEPCSNTGGFKAFNSSSNAGVSTICDGGTPPVTSQTFYHDGSGIGPGNVYPDNGDTVYVDAAGNTVLSPGTYYLYTSGGVNNYMTIGIGGSATTVTCTPPTQTFFISALSATCNNFCTSNFQIGVPRGTTNNASFAGVSVGDTIAGSTLTPGWYAYAASVTNTQSGTFKQMQIDGNNQITSLAECDGQQCNPL